MKYVCEVCGFVYDEELGLPEENIAPGTKFEDLPDDFVCPECGVEKNMFEQDVFANLNKIKRPRNIIETIKLSVIPTEIQEFLEKNQLKLFSLCSRLRLN